MLDPFEEFQGIADRMRDRIADEAARTDRLAAEMAADRALHAEQINEVRLALTVAVDALRSASPRNESSALKIAAAKRTANSLLKGAS
jgi:hypothetical protein